MTDYFLNVDLDEDVE